MSLALNNWALAGVCVVMITNRTFADGMIHTGRYLLTGSIEVLPLCSSCHCSISIFLVYESFDYLNVFVIMLWIQNITSDSRFWKYSVRYAPSKNYDMPLKLPSQSYLSCTMHSISQLISIYHSRNDKLMIFFLLSLEKKIWYFYAIYWRNLHGMSKSKPVFWKNMKSISICPLLEILTRVLCFDFQSFILVQIKMWQTKVWTERQNDKKTCLYNFGPLKHHCYTVKVGFTGVYIIFFFFLLKNIDCGYSLEPPRWGGSNAYTQSMFWA